MGQILVVQGEDPVQAGTVYAKALGLFESLSHLRPDSQATIGSTAVAKFSRLKSETPGIRHSADGRYWICGAGTYFYRGVTGCDGLDLLLGEIPRLEAGDATGLTDLDGIFGLVFGSCSGDDLTVITDRLGSLHLYMATVDSCLVLSTSSMIIAALHRPRWDPVALREFLGTGTIFEQRTLFAGIEKLEPATQFRFLRGKLRARTLYADLGNAMYDRSSVRGDVPQLAEALEESILTVQKNFRNPVCDLTGGFDSRAILGAILRSGCDFQTVVNGASDLPDVITSKQIAGALGLRHLHQPPRITSATVLWERAKESLALCDGEYEVLLYASVYDVHNRLAEQFDVTINGSNGEICKGYWWELLFPYTGWHGHFDQRRVAAKRFAFEQVPELLDFSFPNTLTDHFSDVIDRANGRLQDLPNTAKLDNVYLTLRMQRWQGRIASATSRIWPCVSPFMWRKPMEVALSAPPAVRVRNRMTRRLIEHLDPRLAGIPLAQGYPALPLRWNTAHLFWPLVTEIRQKAVQKVRRKILHHAAAGPPIPTLQSQALKLEEVRDLLNPSRMATRELFRPAELEKILNFSSPNFSTSSRILSRIVTLELLASAIHGNTNC
jgi:hypothetical protein